MTINEITKTDVALFASAVKYPCDNGLNAFDLYAELALANAVYPGKGTPLGLMYVSLGLAEAGEVQGKVKKAFRDDALMVATHHVRNSTSGLRRSVEYTANELTPARRDMIVKELGGLAWYFVATCREAGITPSEVLLANLTELAGRTERGTLQGDGDGR